MHLFFYNKNNKIIVKLKNNILAKKIKKQIFKEVAFRIHAYFIKNNIIITNLCIA